MKEFATGKWFSIKTWLRISESLFSSRLVNTGLLEFVRFRFSSFIRQYMPRSHQSFNPKKRESTKDLFLLSWCQLFSTNQRARFFSSSPLLTTSFDRTRGLGYDHVHYQASDQSCSPHKVIWKKGDSQQAWMTEFLLFKFRRTWNLGGSVVWHI